ncbi:MAG: hypothetical protein UR55_C0016G0017 [Candidatus Nomurabacteria bacterium GW2011_GWF1_34_20]|nr:MAG: hypothetical protein UR55_C0016G0017 [Candidatus Nomurabacteria bacterium GW2011_GWF1_34_20]KKP61623.1 MAG: hypothetical protein UR57_C0015G0019 [Candidatus Nomurabacteria bacterium GW2011_GWE2_34_25]
MAKTSVTARHLKKSKFSTRETNRCFRCSRGHANEGMLPGVRKSSW